MDGDFLEGLLGGIADMFGDGVKRSLFGDAYASGRSTETEPRNDAVQPTVYERILTRPRDPKVNDR